MEFETLIQSRRSVRGFKQKTAYEIGVRLVGSEMCIRDSQCTQGIAGALWRHRRGIAHRQQRNDLGLSLIHI